MTTTNIYTIGTLLALLAVGTQAQDQICSCSPTVFNFVLDLSQTCEDHTIEGNAGIDGSFCFIEEGVAAPTASTLLERPTPTTLCDFFPEVTSLCPGGRKLVANSNSNSGEALRKLQDDADPVKEIVSVQFLEFDTSGDLTVINQDDTYADVLLADGDSLKFNSASSFLDTSLPLEFQTSGPALVPGGASLILYGKTQSGNVVRNRFFWMYDMNCGRDNDPVQPGDQIGWVTAVSRRTSCDYESFAMCH